MAGPTSTWEDRGNSRDFDCRRVPPCAGDRTSMLCPHGVTTAPVDQGAIDRGRIGHSKTREKSGIPHDAVVRSIVRYTRCCIGPWMARRRISTAALAGVSGGAPPPYSQRWAPNCFLISSLNALHQTYPGFIEQTLPPRRLIGRGWYTLSVELR